MRLAQDSPFHRMSVDEQLEVFRLFAWTYVLNQACSHSAAMEHTWKVLEEMAEILKGRGVTDRQLIDIFIDKASMFFYTSQLLSRSLPLKKRPDRKPQRRKTRVRK